MTVQAVDFHFATSEALNDLGGAASRFQHNVAALKLLQTKAAQNGSAPPLSQQEGLTLAHYSGWGDSDVLQRLFPQGAYSWAPVAKELDGVLTKEERESLAASALNAHYTPLPIIRAIYAALEHYGLGFLPQLRVLEPAAGVGHFFGVMPPALTSKAERVAVEIDQLSARICGLLYPNARLFNQPFEAAPLPQDYFDLVISNVPFGNYPIHDPQLRPKYLKAAIHDYYFVRSLALARPGGVIAFLTSRYTLDKLSDRVRRHVAEYAELLDDGAAVPAAEREERLGIYAEVKRALIARGIPAHEIAFIHDYPTAAKQAQAFADLNAGRLRVLIASTERAGCGANFQERLIAAHNLSVPWKPSELEQREGRILRQGNRFAEVYVCNYVTEGSFDSYQWQILESKARFISQIMAGEVTARTAEDVDQLVMTAAQIKAIASGNPQILEKVAAEVELTKLERLYSVWLRNRQRLQWETNDLPAFARATTI
jgi:hypothetical protein